MRLGKVYLVGAGPGDPGLLTVRGLELLRQAQVIVFDQLVNPVLLEEGSVGAVKIFAGKRAGRHCIAQSEINQALIDHARLGYEVVRLKGGDPFVFGRGAEEALALVRAGIPYEVVPGVTTAVAAAELAGIPVTHRGISSAFLVLAGHTAEAVDTTLRSVRPNTLSVVFMMGVNARIELAAKLIANGWAPDTPAAVVCAASTPDAWTWTGMLSDMGAATPPPGLAGVLVIGDVVEVQHALSAAARRPSGARNEVTYGRNR
jgi:uroporphyrin-III C-methyltransferase